MIELKNISKTYTVGGTTVQALRDVDLTVADGEFVVLLGANGSGKSTLLNVIAGNVLPDSGTLTIGGDDITRLHDYRRNKYVSRVFQDPMAGTAPELTILENLRLAAIRASEKKLRIGISKTFRESAAVAIATLELGLETQLDKPVRMLSGGQRQALTLLMAGMDKTQVLLLDEPTAALDPKTAQLVLQQADQLIQREKLTAMLVTHHLKDALQYGSRIVLLSEGRIVKDINKKVHPKLTVAELLEWF